MVLYIRMLLITVADPEKEGTGATKLKDNNCNIIVKSTLLGGSGGMLPQENCEFQAF